MALDDVINSDDTQLTPATLAPGERLYVSPGYAAPSSDPENTQVSVQPNTRLAQALAPQPTLMDQIVAIKDKLLGAGGQQRYQTWPERMVREGVTTAGDIAKPNPYPEGSEEHDWYEDMRSKAMVPGALAISALAGGGALTERPGVATLGSGPVRQLPVKPIEPVPVFYSALEHAATNAAQDTMAPQQWLGYLKNQPGVKKEELDWSGLEDWLGAQKGKVKKEDVQSYLDAHKTEIKDITKSGLDLDDIAPDFDTVAATNVAREHPEWRQHSADFIDAVHWEADRLASEHVSGDPTKYSSYQLPGGENYREHLLTMPEKSSQQYHDVLQKAKKWYEKEYGNVDNFLPEATMDRKSMVENAKDWLADGAINQEDFNIINSPSTQTGYSSSHWDEPNVLAHVRTNDRDIGGQKSLHIEEIQSDWHQQGRKQGYATEKLPEPVREDKGWIVRLPNGKETAYYADREHAIQERDYIAESDPSVGGMGRGVPDAPFKSSWPELALKRMIRHAAENGYDRVSWTPGEAQAARYDLSKQLNKVMYDPDKQHLIAFDKGDSPHINEIVEPKQLPDYIGKDLADKLLAVNRSKEIIKDRRYKESSGDYHKLEGLDLKVGGEGMREFYDKMLPKIAEKIGKSHGVKVKQTELGGQRARVVDSETGRVINSFDDKATAERWLDRTFTPETAAGYKVEEKPQPVHYFDLPQSLKDVALHKGFPLYMTGVPFPLVPVDGDPFKKDK